MCGRLNVTDDPRVKQLMLDLGLPLDPAPRRNVAPGALTALVLDEGDGRQLRDAVWSLLIEAKPGGGYRPNPQWKTFNAQAARLLSSRLWKPAFLSHRAIVPASGFHEWMRLGDGSKQCMNIHPQDAAIAFAALYQIWEFPEQRVISFSIITLPPHPRFAHIHDKSLPLMLLPQDYDLWLDPHFSHVDAFSDLLQSRIRQPLLVTPVKSPASLEVIGPSEIIVADT